MSSEFLDFPMSSLQLYFLLTIFSMSSEFLDFPMSLTNFYHVFHSLARRCTSLTDAQG
jgi:hypothetical protein